jgi:TolB protein
MRVTIPDDGSSLIDAYVANGDGSDATALDTPLRWEIFPALSPDGSSIAFAGGPSEQSLDLYVAAPDGSHPRSIVAGGVEWPIAWSPDSSRIAFVRRAPEGDAIWIVKADSAEAHRVLEGSWTGVAWSPTGEGLAVTGAPPSPTGNKENGYGLYVVQPDGSGLRRLTSSEADPAAEVFDYWPAWSPDGRHIAFARNDALDDITYDSDVYVMGADGSDLRRLTDWPGLDTVPAWSPDGRSLLFTSDRRLTPEQRNQNRERGELRGVSIYSLDLASGNVDLVIEGGGGGAAIFPTSWVR